MRTDPSTNCFLKLKVQKKLKFSGFLIEVLKVVRTRARTYRSAGVLQPRQNAQGSTQTPQLPLRSSNRDAGLTDSAQTAFCLCLVTPESAGTEEV